MILDILCSCKHRRQPISDCSTGIETRFVRRCTPHTYRSHCEVLDRERTPARAVVMERMLAFGVATRRDGMENHEELYYASHFGTVSQPEREAATMTESRQDQVIEALSQSPSYTQHRSPVNDADNFTP